MLIRHHALAHCSYLLAYSDISFSSSVPELPPALSLNLLIPGLEGKLADALGELGYMAAEEVNHFISLL